MNKISLAATCSAILLAQSEAFCPNKNNAAAPSSTLRQMNPPEKPAGSFFHEIPDPDDDADADDSSFLDSAGEESKDINDQVSELLRQRRKPPHASKPSTINGVPTHKATGFGKNIKTKKPSKPFVAIGPPDEPRINDPTKPEFDDQGYTLYTDRETGKKSRVFEALVDYPCDFTMKIVGANEGSFVEEIIAVVAEACEEEPGKIPYRTKVMGKWTSVTVKAPVKSSEMLYTLYEKVDLDPRVKFKF